MALSQQNAQEPNFGSTDQMASVSCQALLLSTFGWKNPGRDQEERIKGLGID